MWAARKTLRPAFAARADLRERLLREGEWLTRCRGCRHVVGIHAVDDAMPALLLEYAPGGTLADALRDDARPGVGRLLPRDRVAALAESLVAALVDVHGRGLVHRDVKPSNVLFAADGAVRLADFGVAAPIGSRGTLGAAWEEDRVGTLGYAAPEQLASPATAVHPAADVYALGVVLWELATGRVPWELRGDETEDELRARVIGGARPPSALAHRATLSRAVADVLSAALDPDPARRPSVAELGAAWRAAW